MVRPDGRLRVRDHRLRQFAAAGVLQDWIAWLWMGARLGAAWADAAGPRAVVFGAQIERQRRHEDVRQHENGKDDGDYPQH